MIYLTIDFLTDIINCFTTNEVSREMIVEYLENNKKKLTWGESQFSDIHDLLINDVVVCIKFFSGCDYTNSEVLKVIDNYLNK